MTFDLFEQALRWGLGRALIYLCDHPSPEARESVLRALLKSNRVDSQEETGVVYLLEAARLCGLQDDLTPVLMTALHDELAADDDFLTIEQLFDLLGELGKNGDRAARQALVDLVPVLIQHHWHHLPDLTAAIAAALGEQGLKLLLSQVGAALLRSQAASDNDLLFFVASRSLGEDTETLLESRALEDPGIRLFLQGSRAAQTQWDSRDSNPVPLDVSYEGIWAKLNEGQFHGISYRGEDASEETLLQLARDLQQETDLSRIALLLCVFHLRPFPLGPDFLISLLHHRSRQVKQHALRALTQFEGEAIHELALEGLLRPKY
ncbi:hypothetical protein [Deinococcus cellulosilyticus]|uniref:Uncharacterized protein n=1 Tax=Deinococcus cellulosilyticus (strain DSM 18568 / NBRC 106333 / KACC 11606 / 5516J-15) TaxID=1223518 RepID=A0A511N687_DEIC1|nr:hypothetical protein [Deinococcus cellulosilyticus]GEM48392.1 hypothetical protein DC3_40270 [Deinococcus cellulosilyticus NBRC 106333 = KACC 11606]